MLRKWLSHLNHIFVQGIKDGLIQSWNMQHLEGKEVPVAGRHLETAVAVNFHQLYPQNRQSSCLKKMVLSYP